MEDIEDKARAFAMQRYAASGQVRNYTGDPYHTHPAAVVELVRGVPHSKEMLAAAWLHDLVEDKLATLREILRLFGRQVARLVKMLTDVSKPSDGNRAARKAIDRAHTAKADPEAKTIKLADVIHNAQDIVQHAPDFARVYLPEKALLLEVLREGDATLWEMADDLIKRAMCNNTVAA